ncbi:Dehydrogenase/reductase SDR family protein 7-like [Lamellibrachia satsuma]|nr:Dehydrogenase/reductase SDR family protein 7-like [Lamellibrachia satsuma]
MEDGRLPKDILYGQLTSSARPVGRPALRFKDACNRDMKACDISPKGWEAVAEDRTAWRQTTRRGIERADEKKRQHAAEKRMRRKQKAALPPMSSCFVCFGCGKDCHSRIGLHATVDAAKILQIDNGAHQHRLFETTLFLLLLLLSHPTIEYICGGIWPNRKIGEKQDEMGRPLVGTTTMAMWTVAIVAVGAIYLTRMTLQWLRECSLQGRVVLITGASSGLGEACAHVFYEAGAKVILCARRVNELERVKRELQQLKLKETKVHEPMVLPLDLTDFEAVASKVEKAISFHGCIDILINNGGISSRGSVIDTLLDVHMKVMNVNYFGQVALTKAILPHMISARRGRIVAVSSLQGKFAMPFRSAYGPSKHALQAFFDSLRAEVAPYSIGVSVVSPGYIQTDLSVNAVTSTGDRNAVMDAATTSGMTPQYVASRILQAVARRQNDVVVAPLLYRMVVLLRVLHPNLFFWIMARRAKKEAKLKNN